MANNSVHKFIIHDWLARRTPSQFSLCNTELFQDHGASDMGSDWPS